MREITILNFEEAAKFLRMSESTLYQKVRARIIPAAKPGKQWKFIKEDLVEFLQMSYLKKPKGNINLSWPSINEEKTVSIKSNSQPQTVSEYERALGLKTANKLKN